MKLKYYIAILSMVSSYLYSCYAKADTFEEAFGLNLFDKGNNKVRLGMYSNESGDKSSLGIEFNLNKKLSGTPNYPNRTQNVFTSPPVGPAFTPNDLINIANDDFSSLTEDQLARLAASINHERDDYTLFYFNFSAQGMFALDNKDNLKDFSKLKAEGAYKEWRSNQYTYSASAFAAYETDQSNDNSQTVYGLSLFGQYYFVQGRANEYAFLKVEYAQVDPADNQLRLSLLNGEKSTYYRWELDITTQFQVSIDEIDKVEISYRYFKEVDAPAEIQEAGMSTFGFLTAGIYFDKGWYIAFSDGKLPFSEKDDQIYQLGWSYSFD